MMLGNTLFATWAFWISFTLFQSAASASEEKKLKPCTIRSSTTGKFFDLTPISIRQQSSSDKDDEELTSWHAKGYDYPANFTLNFCAPVVEELKDVVGVDEDRWQNISAFYMMSGKTYSIGEMQDEPVIRGSKLVLNYTNGSPCDSSESSTIMVNGDDLSQRKIVGGGGDNGHDSDGDKGGDGDDNGDKDDDGNNDNEGDGGDKGDDDKNKNEKDNSGCTRRKQTIISLLCDKDPLAAAKASVSFVGQTDQCTYIFEARSSAACGGIEAEKQSLGPAGVFGVIATIAVIVYFVGGCMYQRTVMHQRGWRQIPNYALWAGIFGFFRDIFIILTSTCARFFPSRRGYSPVAISGGRRGRNSHSEDENRLIDQLDEEWDD